MAPVRAKVPVAMYVAGASTKAIAAIPVHRPMHFNDRARRSDGLGQLARHVNRSILKPHSGRIGKGDIVQSFSEFSTDLSAETLEQLVCGKEFEFNSTHCAKLVVAEQSSTATRYTATTLTTGIVSFRRLRLFPVCAFKLITNELRQHCRHDHIPIAKQLLLNSHRWA